MKAPGIRAGLRAGVGLALTGELVRDVVHGDLFSASGALGWITADASVSIVVADASILALV